MHPLSAKLVWMVIVCMVPNGNQMKEAWRLERPVSPENCLIMSATVAVGGVRGSISVSCKPMESAQ